MVKRSRDHVSTIRTFAGRNDSDRAKREVADLAAMYEGLSTREDFVKRFPDFPVRSPLVDYLTAEEYSNSTPLLFVITYPSEAYTTVAEWSRQDSGSSRQQLRGSFDRERALFDGVDVSAGRGGRFLLDVDLRSRSGSTGHTPVYVQRFETNRRAVSARSSLDVFDEGTVEIGHTTWERIFYHQDPGIDYPEDGDVVYTYVARIGRYLIAAAPSGTAWDERTDDSTDLLKQTWLFG